MKKMKKLLSVLLAVVLALSCMSVMASAKITAYKSVDELEALGAYSPYGTVTRLSTEDRMSIVFDFLDIVLGNAAIYMPIDLGITKLEIDLRSVDGLLATLDTFKGLLENFLIGGVVKSLLGRVGDHVSLSTWSTKMNRTDTNSLNIVYEITELLGANQALVADILANGLDLGTVGSLAGLDFSAINDVIGDLPGMIRGLIIPMFERWDDTIEEVDDIEEYTTGTSDKALSTILSTFIGNYFKKPMSMTTVKADSTGEIVSDHTLPSGDTHRRKFVQSGTTITVYEYYTQTDVDKNELDDITTVGYMKLGTYEAQEEYPGVEGTDYVFVQVTDSKGVAVEFGQTLKYYEKESYWLPNFVKENGTIDIKTESAAELLYKMIPYVFETMAPTVVNGSLKKLLAGLFGMQFNEVGSVDNGTYVAYEDAKVTVPETDLTNTFFTEAQGEYVWEWSNYAVINGTHYYRFEDQIFMGDASNCNDYFKIIKWDFTLTGDFLDEFIPAGSTGTETTAAGNTRILHGVNDFVCKLADLVLAKGATDIAGTKTFTFTLTEGGNENLVSNVKALAQALLGFHPEHIFGATYDDEGNVVSYGDFYNMIMSDDNDTVLVGVAGLVIDALAPQVIIEPEAIYDASTGTAKVTVGALLAAMLRELATQLLPSVNYDKLIYASYNTGEFVSGKDNDYWLDVLLTIGTDIGFKYLHNLADMNEDNAAWTALGWTDKKEYTEADLKLTEDVNLWEQRVDYVIDWALTVDSTDDNLHGDGNMCVWNMLNLVGKHLTDWGTANGKTITVNLATAQNPWDKLDAVFDGILFFDQFTSTTDLEVALRGTILNLVNLEWDSILGSSSKTGLLDIPTDSKLRTTNVLEAVSLEIRDLVNGLFIDVGNDGSDYYLIPVKTGEVGSRDVTAITSIDGLLTETGIIDIVYCLLGRLDDAWNNGLLTTALPILNFFVGWTTDPQKYAEPLMVWANTNDAKYLYSADGSTVNTTLNITNNASGMLLKHRSDINNSGYSSQEDSAYVLKVTGVKSADVAGTITAKNLNTAINPYDTLPIEISFPYEHEGEVVLEITYEFTGKDGKSVGGEQSIFAVQYVSKNADASTQKTAQEAKTNSDCDKVKAARNEFNTYLFTNNLKAVEGYGYTYQNTGENYNMWCSAATLGTDSTSPIKVISTTKFLHGESENKNLNPEGAIMHTKSKDTDKSVVWTLYPYYVDETVTHEPVSGSSYKLAAADLTFSSSKGSIDFSPVSSTLYYYDIADLEAVWNQASGIMVDDYDTTNADVESAWNTFKAAREAATKLVMGPKVVSTFATDYAAAKVETIKTNLENAITALNEAAREADAEASATGASDTTLLEAALERDTSVNGTEINYQDFDLFEYFEYQDYRTNARNIMNTMKVPEVLVGGYIEGSGISYEELTTSVIPAAEVTNSNVAIGIENSITMYTDEEIAASQKAHDDFVAPNYSKLYLDNEAALINYYREFLLPVAADTAFLENEIAYANANFTDSTIYTADSWAAFQDALAAANSVIDGTHEYATVPSQVFAVKFSLMKAMKNLLLKSESAIEAGEVDNLIALKAEAEAIFAMNYDDIELSDDAIAAGMTKDEALGHLIRAVGYYYTGEDGNEWNLYADSALEYIDNDRPNKSTNLAKIAATETNLTAAIAYFATESEVEFVGKENDGTTGQVKTTSPEDAEKATGYVYGIKVGQDAKLFFTTNDTGSIDITPSAAGATNGTGAVVVVKDKNHNVVGEYTLIVFGDVDGNGQINTADKGTVDQYVGGTSSKLSGAYELAADLDANGAINTADKGTMDQCVGGTASKISQSVGLPA